MCTTLLQEEDVEEEVPPYDDDVYEDVEVGGSGEDDGDEPSQVYASVSADHKAKKRYTFYFAYDNNIYLADISFRPYYP